MTHILNKVKILEVGEVVFKSKSAEHGWNSNDICLLRDAGLKAVVLENLVLEIEIVLFARIFDFVRIELGQVGDLPSEASLCVWCCLSVRWLNSWVGGRVVGRVS